MQLISLTIGIPSSPPTSPSLARMSLASYRRVAISS